MTTGNPRAGAKPYLTAEDIAGAQEQFDACDPTGDGAIQFAEFSNLLEKLGSALPAEEQRARFDDIDSDHDGRIDNEEFMNWWRGS